MKLAFNFLTIFFMICLFGCSTFKSYVNPNTDLLKIKKILVLPFKSNSPNAGVQISDSLMSSLIESRFQVIERSNLEIILSEQKLALGAIIDNPNIIIGKIKGIDAIIVGSVTIQTFININYISDAAVRMIDLNTGENLIAITYYNKPGDKTDELLLTLTELGNLFAKKICKF